MLTRKMTRRVLRVLTVVVALAQPSPSAALFPGDCGKPSSAGVLSNDPKPVASDAQAVLSRAANVASVPCSKHICDVDGNGNVRATDGLAVLRKAVGLSVTFNVSVRPTAGRA